MAQFCEQEKAVSRALEKYHEKRLTEDTLTVRKNRRIEDWSAEIYQILVSETKLTEPICEQTSPPYSSAPYLPQGTQGSSCTEVNRTKLVLIDRSLAEEKGLTW